MRQRVSFPVPQPISSSSATYFQYIVDAFVQTARNLVVQLSGYPALDKTFPFIGGGCVSEAVFNGRFVEPIFQHNRAEMEKMGFVQLLNDRCPFPCVHLVSCGKYEVSCPDYRFVPTETGTRVQGYVLAYGTQFVVQAVHVSFGESLLKIVEVFATHAPVEFFQARFVQMFESRPEYFGGDAFLDVDSAFGSVDGRGVSYGESFIG